MLSILTSKRGITARKAAELAEKNQRLGKCTSVPTHFTVCFKPILEELYFEGSEAINITVHLFTNITC